MALGGGRCLAEETELAARPSVRDLTVVVPARDEEATVAAVVERDGRYLICQRPLHKRHGGLWFWDESFVISRRRE